MDPERPYTYPDKPGQTVTATPADHLWLQGLLRYTRNAELATSTRIYRGASESGATPPYNGDTLPNVVTLFAGFSSHYQPGQLSFLFRSYPHTDHSRYIAATQAEAARIGRARSAHIGNVAIKLAHSDSPDLTLTIEGRAVMLAQDSKMERLALEALLRSRRQKGLQDVTLDPQHDEDERQRMHIVRPLAIFTQGQRLNARERHVGEGHPILRQELLLGFEDLPGLPSGVQPPRRRDQLFDLLRVQNYQHPALA